MKPHLRKSPSSVRQVFAYLLPFLTIGLVISWSASAFAADRNFIATGSGTRAWSTASYWQENAAPASGDKLYFSIGGSASQASTNDIAAGTSFAGIFLNGSRSMVIDGNAIKLSGDINNTTSNQKLEVKLSIELLSGSHQMKVDSTHTSGTTIANGGTISGTGSIVKEGTGLLIIDGTSNSFSGGITVNAGTLRSAQSGTVFGTGTLDVQSGAVVQLYSKSIELSSISGAGTIGNYHTSSDVILTVNTTSLSNVFSGLAIDGDTRKMGITKSNTGTLTLSNTSSTYTGVTSVTGGILEVKTLADGGSASSIGQSTNAAANLVLDGGTLQYTGTSSASTDRLFRIGNNGATIDSSGTGTLTFSNTGAVDLGTVNHIPHQLTLKGSNSGANTLALSIADKGTGKTTLDKLDSGKWILSANNNYSGATTINAGTLIINGAQANSAVTVKFSGTLGGHGSVGAISGAGMVAPGNSPGVLTALSVDPSSDMAFSFEFTALGAPDYGSASASKNDVLHLTASTPFTSTLTSDNVVTLDFSALSPVEGNVFQGGFYVDNADFFTSIKDATYQYVGLGGLGVTVSTIQQTANFGNGNINGYVTQFTIIPESHTTAYLVLAAVGLIFMTVRRRYA